MDKNPIENTRNELIKLGTLNGLKNKKVIAKSQELDKLIYQYLKKQCCR